MEQGSFDLAGLIVAGGLSTYPLLVGSIVAVGVVIDRLWALRGTERSVASLAARLGATLSTAGLGARASESAGHGRAGAVASLEVFQGAKGGPASTAAPFGAGQSGGAAALVLEPVARAVRLGAAEPEVSRLLDARLFEALEGLRRRLWMLATIGTIAPFVGLFGTVIGIMKSFHFIAESGTGGFAVVASGISEALVATALGLAVGVVAVGFYNYFEARLERVEAALRIAAGYLIEAAPASLAA